MPRLSTLRAPHLEVCDNTLKERGLIAPNLAILAAIVFKSPTLMRLVVTGYNEPLIRKWGPPSLDTYERDYLLDMVALEYTGVHWPCNGDGPDTMTWFIETLIERASHAGWVFDNLS